MFLSGTKPYACPTESCVQLLDSREDGGACVSTYDFGKWKVTHLD